MKFRKNHITAAKLTPEKVLAIRLRFQEGETQGALAREFQVSVGQIGRITRGESWQAYQQPEDLSEAEHQRVSGILKPEPTEQEIAESQARLVKLLSGEELCEHGLKKTMFCMDCFRAREAKEQGSGLEKLETIAVDQKKLESELDELIGDSK